LVNTPLPVHRPQHSLVELSDLAETQAFLQTAYGTWLRLARKSLTPSGDSLLLHVRVDVGAFAIDDVYVRGEWEAAHGPFNKVMGVWVTAGRMEGHCDGIRAGATTGDITMVAQPYLSSDLRSQNLRETVVAVDPAVIASAAAGVPAEQATLPIRFSSFTPFNTAAAQGWKDTVSYVKDVVLADFAVATPLVLGRAARLLAAVTLSTFPNTAIADPTPHDRTDHQPVLLRRALEFIEANVAEDIGLPDIAVAVRVTPRAVQYMFRRHLDTTPLQYLRRLRLQYAHHDLSAADPARRTVGEIASRWGFMDTARFAVLYRKAYGQDPEARLHGWALSDDLMTRLLRTLLAYHGVGGDLTRAAAVLAVHRSTVRYRLYRIRELTGLPPGDPRTGEALRDIALRRRCD
jgi:AraC-like DNA-binding protein